MFLLLFFIYVFPLFFSYIGEYKTSPIVAIFSLCLGALLWTFYNFTLYRTLIGKVRKAKRDYDSIMANGKRVNARVEKKLFNGQDKFGYEDLELSFRLENYSGSQVLITTEVQDSKPELKRFEVGNTVELMLADSPDRDLIVGLVGSQAELSLGPRYLLVLLSLAYPIIVLIVQYYFFNDGMGFRFLSPFHPWLWGPIIGFIFLKLVTGSKKTQRRENRLLLYGISTLASIDNLRNTGTYINDQPQLKIHYSFTDNRGNTINQNIRSVIPQSSLNKLQGEVEIIYDPNDPSDNKLMI